MHLFTRNEHAASGNLETVSPNQRIEDQLGRAFLHTFCQEAAENPFSAEVQAGRQFLFCSHTQKFHVSGFAGWALAGRPLGTDCGKFSKALAAF